MKKEQILIVEDEPIIFRRMRKALEKEHYSIDEYTPSVVDAIGRINNKRPDLVLLDIKLQGKETGLDLGKKLQEDYKIPFIYVTDFDDNQTFFKGLETNHEHFIVKTKPQLNSKELVRAIQTVLKRNEIKGTGISKEGIIGLVGYLDEIKDYKNGGITRVPVKYSDIAFFSTKPFVNEAEKKEIIRPNYLWFLTKKNEYYFLKSSLKELLKHLPHYFVRINESCIVNISSDVLNGRINGSKLSIMNKELKIKDTYSQELKKCLKLLYHS